MNRKCFFIWLCAVFLSIHGVNAEEKPDFQRYDAERNVSELSIETTLRSMTLTAESGELYTLLPRMQMGYTFMTRHTIAVLVPFAFSLYEDPNVEKRFSWSAGDIQLSYEYFFPLNHISLYFTPILAISPAKIEDASAFTASLAGNTERISFGASTIVTGIRDPVVWSAGFQYLAGLPKYSEDAKTYLPGNMQFSFTMSDLVNERFGASVGFYQTVNLPQIKDGQFDEGGLSVSTLLRFETFVLFEHDYIRVFLETCAYPLQQPVICGVLYGHQFVIKKH